MAEQKKYKFLLEIDDKGAISKLKSTEKGIKDLDFTSKKAQNALKSLNAHIKSIGGTGNIKSIKLTSKELEQLSNKMGGTSAATGAATSAAMEFGRVISDAPYGIRGMGNNLSQLASNLFYMSRATDGATGKALGFGGAMKSLVSTMLGPVGILIAVQAIIAIFEALSNSTGGLTDKMAELESAGVNETTGKLMMLSRALKDTTFAMEDKLAVTKKAAEEFEEINAVFDGTADSLLKVADATDIMITSMMETSKAKGMIELANESIKKLIETEAKGDGLFANMFTSVESFSMAMNGIFNPAMNEATAGVLAQKVAVSGIQEEIDKYYDLLKDKSKTGQTYMELLFGDNKKNGGARRRFALYKQSLLDLQKFIIDQNREEYDIITKHERTKLNISQQFEQEDLKATLKSYKEKNARRLEDFLKKKRTDAEIAQANKTFREANLDAEREYEDALTALKSRQQQQRFEFEEKLRKRYADMIAKSNLEAMRSQANVTNDFGAGLRAGRLNQPMSSVGAESAEQRIEAQRNIAEAERAEFFRQLEIKKNDLIEAGFSLKQVEAQIANERTVFLQQQATQEIELERDKLEAKKNINLEYVSWVQGLGGIMRGIAGENEALATMALILEKGAAIADIVIRTQASNAQITAAGTAEAAHWSNMAAATAAVGGSPAFMALAAAAQVNAKKRIVKNKIGAGIAIANIAATTLTSKGGVGGGGGAASEGAGGRTFDFNLVGSTGENQVATAIGSQMQEPIQAYVVSSQITSQQQLDNVIQTQAEF
jgi:hypothetical protein